ncbi:zinc finger BED domain-containing protein RICESLEEPER 2 [Artemisia annua]|uniref:Zinc finger BED domain-containing protein RICESLEEPER 2 n=1 Tax=Artemisia annua TaxID=35608 RepID=A0A2U1LUK3_ARTAN|nr:zinc finger BED domain-containing protein RICESLEEPER 2 [Artemisia annua]
MLQVKLIQFSFIHFYLIGFLATVVAFKQVDLNRAGVPLLEIVSSMICCRICCRTGIEAQISPLVTADYFDIGHGLLCIFTRNEMKGLNTANLCSMGKSSGDDTIVEDNPILNIDESDSSDGSEPSVVVVAKARKAQSGKRKRNCDKEEEEYEIYAKTNKERASIWQHYDPVRGKKDGLRTALCKFCNKTLATHGPNGTSGLHKHCPCPSNPDYVPKNLVKQQTHLEFKKNPSGEANAVKYIRYSSQRINKFKRCMEEANLESNRFLCGECPTRWNSKHDMLKIACSLREVFCKYELEDNCYYRDLERVPEHSDFGVCEGVVEFLEKFKVKTELISSSSKPLAHLFYREILDIDKHLRYWVTKPELCHMVDDMVKKYNMYWGKFDELNDYMYFAAILDPTMKQNLVSHGFKKMLKYNMSS